MGGSALGIAGYVARVLEGESGERRSTTPTHHDVHGSPASELVPAEHESHITLPLAVDSRPAGHAAHDSPPEFVPSPSTTRETRVTYEPRSHSAHEAAPSTPLNMPTAHGKHWSADTAPASARKVPIGHF